MNPAFPPAIAVLYLCVALFVGRVAHSIYNRLQSPNNDGFPGLVTGLFWPLGVPLLTVFLIARFVGQKIEGK